MPIPSPKAEWPAAEAALREARSMLAGALPRGLIALACDNDVDGLAAAELFRRSLERRGGRTVVLPARRGEHVHLDSMRARIRACEPAALVVLDMGSRAGKIVPGLPTLLVDHHAPAGFPEGAVIVSAFGHDPVAPTGLLAYELLRSFAAIEDLDWLALLAITADLGMNHPFEGWMPVARRYGRGHVREAVSLLNAARRAGTFRAEEALDVLAAASEPADIAGDRIEGTAVLRACRDEVQNEVRRCARTAPRIAGRYALLRFSSPAQVHPLVAVRWRTRLRGLVVIAANDGFLPGRVNFAMRTSDPALDLVQLLRALPLRPVTGELGHGHPQATGGSLIPLDFERLLNALGFEDAA